MTVRIAGWVIITGMLMSNALLAEEPTGASLIWTSVEPDLVEARSLISAGDLRAAEQKLLQRNDEASRQGIEIIRRIRLGFALDESGLLHQLRQSIPTVTSDQLSQWRATGDLDYRVLDGKVCYFSRAAGNLFRRSRDARLLSGLANGDVKKSGWPLTDHLAAIIAASKKPGDAAVLPLKHHVKYSLTVDLPDWVRVGSIAKIWLPYPQEDRQQTQLGMIATSVPPTLISPPTAPHRTVYFEIRIGDVRQPLTVSEQFEFVCCAWYPQISDEQAMPLKNDWGDQCLTERLPHIAFTDAMKQQVAAIVRHETNPLKRARLIFHWINANIPWCAEQEYCIVPSLSIKGLTSRTGDCGIQGALFITMCRIAGVPARWQSGWQLRPNDAGMHDWAEFYCEPWGWLPADASYGLNPSTDPAVREFYFGHQDAYRMTVNCDYGRDLIPPKQSLRSEPADFQRGEVEIDGRNLYFDQWDYNFAVTTTPGDGPR